MFKVWLTNHQYFSQRTFDTLADALAWARTTCFQCSIVDADMNVVAHWCPIAGTRYVNN